MVKAILELNVHKTEKILRFMCLSHTLIIFLLYWGPIKSKSAFPIHFKDLFQHWPKCFLIFGGQLCQGYIVANSVRFLCWVDYQQLVSTQYQRRVCKLQQKVNHRLSKIIKLNLTRYHPYEARLSWTKKYTSYGIIWHVTIQ